jgi:hypothetical protein
VEEFSEIVGIGGSGIPWRGRIVRNSARSDDSRSLCRTLSHAVVIDELENAIAGLSFTLLRHRTCMSRAVTSSESADVAECP